MRSCDTKRLVRNFLAVRPVYFALFGLGACLFALATVVTRWTSTESAFVGVGGFIPVSDAMGYFRCALSAAGSALPSVSGLSADWCGRRILYPLSLLTLLSVGGFNPAFVLLIQALIIGACIGVSMIAVSRAFSKTAGFVVGSLCAVFAYQWATANFMTEFLGLSAGLVSASLLLVHAVERKPAMAVAGVAMLSLALAARAGALFALPPVCIWCYFTVRPANQALHFPSLFVITAVALLGPILQIIGAAQVGANLGNFGGNFSTSLYDLSTGSRNWDEAYQAFGHLFLTLPEGEVFQIVQAKALENIGAQPRIFLASLYGAASLYVGTLFGFVTTGRLNQALTALLVVGVLRCLIAWRSPAMSLTLIVFLGELLAAPFVIDGGGHRVFAATVWCRALLAGVGASMCVAVLTNVRSIKSSQKRKTSAGSKGAAWALAVVLMALVITPMTPLATLMSPRFVESRHACPTNQIPEIVNFKAESMAIGVANQTKLPLWGTLIVAPGRFDADDLLRQSSWGHRLGPMPPGSWVGFAFDRQVDFKGRLLPLFWQGVLPESANGLYAICVGDADRGKQLGDFELRRLESIEAFNGR